MSDVTAAAGLAGFLLARIAEDEALWCGISRGPRRAGKTLARQRIADLEAKRRIVEECVKYEHAAAPYYDGGRNPLTRAILHALALPYADHPDFREEWRA